MKRGPKPKPTVLEDLHGRPGHRKKNAAEPKPTGDLFTPPWWLTSSQKTEWRYIVDHSAVGLRPRGALGQGRRHQGNRRRPDAGRLG
jgi:hypothetical protein